MGLQQITGNEIAAGSIAATDLASASITGDKLGATSINANNIVGGTITTTQIASNTISNTNIQTGAIENYSRATGLLSGMRNRIINGAMVIDQRKAGASVTPSDGQYTLDRWVAFQSAASKYSVQQNAGAVTPPVGFSNYLGVTSLSAYSVGSSDYNLLQQPIEGFNFADCNWGTANAKTVTLSFWVRSSLTGTFGGSLVNSANNRSYPYSYTISSANTWDQKSITVAGDTSGTWVGATNGVGLKVNFGIGVGTTYSGTAGAWAGSQYFTATGATSVVGTNGATFYITGVQLEVGSTATSFDYRPYTTELQLCQRYFEKSFSVSKVPDGSLGSSIYAPSFSDQSNNAVYNYKLSVEKRANPTITFYLYNGTSGSFSYVSSGGTSTVTPTVHENTTTGVNFYLNIGAAWTGCNIYGSLTASSEL